MSTSTNNPTPRRQTAIILAAGKGTRMGSDLPKVAHPVAGQPMVCWVVEACRAVGVERIILVIGHHAQTIREIFAGDDGDLEFVTQAEQLGTGHAVGCARNPLEPLSDDLDALVLAGDGPLIRSATLRALIDRHRETNAAATLATAVLDQPGGYGRIVRDRSRRFVRIVEEKDATAEQQAIREINPSYYCFRAKPLFRTLQKLTNDNAKGEYYLTDVFERLLARGQRVEVIDAVPPADVLSINTPAQLAEVDEILRGRIEAVT